MKLLEEQKVIVKSYDCEISDPEELIDQFITMIDSDKYFKSVNDDLFYELTFL